MEIYASSLQSPFLVLDAKGGLEGILSLSTIIDTSFTNFNHFSLILTFIKLSLCSYRDILY